MIRYVLEFSCRVENTFEEGKSRTLLETCNPGGHGE